MTPGSKNKQFHVLLLEDAEKTCQLVALALEKKLDCRVTIASSHEHIHTLVKKDPPDLFLLDFYIDKERGLEVCESFKNMEAMADVPVVFFSDEGDALLRAAAIRAGGVEYIKKPFFPNELITRVKSHIDLQESRVKTQAQLREQQALLRVLCHDLLNPVAAVKTALSLIEDVNPENREVLEIATEANQSALQLIEHVRNYRRLTDYDRGFERHWLDLRDAINSSLGIVSALAENKGIRLVAMVEDNAKIFINQVVFTHNILNNLLTNAIKFSYKDAEVRVVALTRSEEGKKNVIVRVEDDGIGIPPEVLPVIFQPAQTNSRPGTEGELGTGFGMPLVKHYVEESKGEIFIESHRPTDGNAPWTGTRIEMCFAMPSDALQAGLCMGAETQ